MFGCSPLVLKWFTSYLSDRYQRTPDWKVCIAQPRSRVRNFGRNAVFIRASEKLLHNISSSSAHLESEESVSARAALKKKRERKKMRTGK